MIDTLFGIGRVSTLAESATELADINLDTVEECAGDPFEFATAAVYENEMMMQNIDAAIMVCEYAYLKETGTEMIFEENVVTNFFKQALAMVKKAWNKVVAFFKKIFGWVEGVVRNDKSFVKKYKDDCKKASPVDLEFKGYKFDIAGIQQMPGVLLKTGTDYLSELQNPIKQAATKLVTGKTDEDNMDDLLDTVVTKLCNCCSSYSGEVSYEDYKKEIVKAMRGGSDKVTLKNFNCSTAIDEVATAKATKAQVKKLFDAAKRIFQADIAYVKATQKLTTKAVESEKSDKQEATKSAHAAIKGLNKLISITVYVNHKACSAITANNRQNKKCIIMALKKQDKDDKKDDKKDDNTSTTNESFVSNVFDALV